jgi:sec-independent protein translocase protein TatB
MSFGEMVILGVIALVVVGPRRLPSMLRSAGQLIGKVRRMAMEIRTESGIDEILDAEGIRSEIDNFRRLATGEISLDDPPKRILPDRDLEYPGVGCDAYGALSEDIIPYVPSPAVEAPAAAEEPAAAAASSAAEVPSTAEDSPAAEEPLAVEERSRAIDPAPSVGTDGALSSTGAEVKN